jgi:DUF4097 and DUF4098 domain-containing protein YvlB
MKTPYARSGCTDRLMILFAVVLAGVLGAAACEADSWHEETVQQTIPVSGEELLVLVTKSGDIEVTGEKGRTDIELRLVKKIKAKDAEEAERIAAMVELEVDREEDAIRVSIEYSKRGEDKRSIFSYLFDRYPRIDLALFLTIPAELELELETASGDMKISDMESDVAVTAASGDVELDRIGGGVVVNVASGDIDVSEIGGEARLMSASGDVSGRGISGDCVVHTASGDVDMTDLGGDVELHSVSGDATVDGVRSVAYNGMSGSVRFTGVRGGVSASAASGDLTFELIPRNREDYTIRTSSGAIDVRFIAVMTGGYVLKASTTTGNIEATLPIKISKVGRNNISGIVRDGASKIILETASGDISISEPEE